MTNDDLYGGFIPNQIKALETKKELSDNIKKLKKLKKESNRQDDEAINFLKNLKKEQYGTHLKKYILISAASFGIAIFGYNQIPTIFSSIEISDEVTARKDNLEEKIDEISRGIGQQQPKKHNNRHHMDNFLTSYDDRGYFYFPVRGDYLVKISKYVSGRSDNFHKIMAANGLRSDLIEVNQILKIPREIVRYDNLLFNGVLSCRIYHAEKNDTLYSISRKIYESNNHAKKVRDFNLKYNPRFDDRIWKNEWVLLPK